MSTLHTLKRLVPLLTFSLVACSFLFVFPQAAYASCTAKHVDIGTGTDPSTTTVAPGSSILDGDAFTVVLTVAGNPCPSTDTITAMTIQLANSGTPYSGLDSVRITSSDGLTLYFAAVASTSISSNSVSFSGGTGVPVTTSAVTFKIRITPMSHKSMPAPNGASYAFQATTTATNFTATNTTGSLFTDTMTNTITFDNLSPAAATSLSASAGNAKATLGWTSTSGETSTSTILRWASSSAGSEVPTEGASYTAGNTISTATVACVFKALTTATVESGIVDGTGGTAGCTTSALTNNQAYTYKIFQQDSNGNYDTGASMGTVTPINVTAPTVTTNSAETFTPTTATLFGAITATGGADATESGFAYSTDSALSTSVSTTTLGAQTGTASFNSSISGLSAGTTYYYRAYATNSAGTGYGTILNFTTGNTTPSRRMRLFEGFTIKLYSGQIILYQQ